MGLLSLERRCMMDGGKLPTLLAYGMMVTKAVMHTRSRLQSWFEASKCPKHVHRVSLKYCTTNDSEEK